MINLEVWSSAGYNMEPWIDAGLLVDNGPLGPVGKFGWFMTSTTVEEEWQENHTIIDHWRALQKQTVVSKFPDFDGIGFVGPAYGKPLEYERVTNKQEQDIYETVDATAYSPFSMEEWDTRAESLPYHEKKTEGETLACVGENCPITVFRPQWCKKPLQQHCLVLLTNYQGI